MQPSYSLHTAFIQPYYSLDTALIQPLYSLYTAIIQPYICRWEMGREALWALDAFAGN